MTRRTTAGLRVSTRSTKTLALNKVAAHLDSGELLVLHGASGTGKSSLIGALLGLLKPDSGRVTWGGDEPLDQPDGWDSRVLAARIGWVPQFSEATVVGGTVLASMIATSIALGQDEAAARARALALLAALGLEHCANRHPLRLSGGEQRRLAVATGVMHGPAVLGLDEPTVGLDRHTWASVTGLLMGARNTGMAVLASSHDDHLKALADRTQALVAPAQPPAAPPSPMRGLLSRCGPLWLLATVVIFLAGGVFVSDLKSLGIGVAALLILGPILTGFRFPLIRLLPAVIGVASVTWSNWLLADPRSWEVAAAAGLRVAFIALPGIVVVSYLDPTRLGDQLGQTLHLPARPVLATVAALQRLDDMHCRWLELSTSRRTRGLLPGKSPVARVKHGISLMFALLIDAVRQSGRLTLAMETRGYSSHLGGDRKRSWAESAPITGADVTLLVLSVLVAAVPMVVLLTQR